eukprot:scaffold86682_cov63-Phaeocystis_antarctica.AAC.1
MPHFPPTYALSSKHTLRSLHVHFPPPPLWSACCPSSRASAHLSASESASESGARAALERLEEALQLLGLTLHRHAEPLREQVDVEAALLRSGAARDGEHRWRLTLARLRPRAEGDAQPRSRAIGAAERRRAALRGGAERAGEHGCVLVLEEVEDMQRRVGVQQPQHAWPHRAPHHLQQCRGAEALPRAQWPRVVRLVERERSVRARGCHVAVHTRKGTEGQAVHRARRHASGGGLRGGGLLRRLLGLEGARGGLGGARPRVPAAVQHVPRVAAHKEAAHLVSSGRWPARKRLASAGLKVRLYLLWLYLLWRTSAGLKPMQSVRSGSSSFLFSSPVALASYCPALSGT